MPSSEGCPRWVLRCAGTGRRRVAHPVSWGPAVFVPGAFELVGGGGASEEETCGERAERLRLGQRRVSAGLGDGVLVLMHGVLQRCFGLFFYPSGGWGITRFCLETAPGTRSGNHAGRCARCRRVERPRVRESPVPRGRNSREEYRALRYGKCRIRPVSRTGDRMLPDEAEHRKPQGYRRRPKPRGSR